MKITKANKGMFCKNVSVITIFDKLKLLFTPMIKSHNEDGNVNYKMDKKGHIYVYKIEPKKEVETA